MCNSKIADWHVCSGNLKEVAVLLSNFIFMKEHWYGPGSRATAWLRFEEHVVMGMIDHL